MTALETNHNLGVIMNSGRKEGKILAQEFLAKQASNATDAKLRGVMIGLVLSIILFSTLLLT